MVQARRASPASACHVPLAVAAALLVGGSLAAWKFWPNETTAGPQAASSTTAAESQAPSIAESSPHPRPLLIPPARPRKGSRGVPGEGASRGQSEGGKTGVLHWIDHVQVQTDDFAGKLTPAQRKARFAKTRLKGPGGSRPL